MSEPKVCLRCTECEGRHHYSEAMISYAEEEPDHPAAKAGHVAWFDCKHCEAWTLDPDGDE